MSLWRKRQIAEKVKYMSYQDALTAAGATVISFESFGSWQGEWVALVEYRGERGWVQGSFGSCDHCDAFEAEFGWDADEKDNYQARLASFGESYLGGLQTTQQVLSQFEEVAEWDSDAEDAILWIRETQQTYRVV
jgi:hypothetical protein